jgi:hypothetical protein
MYYLIGADGKEYGPVSADTLREWIVQGRANAQSYLRTEGGTEWKLLATFPEFSAAVGVAPTPTPGAAPVFVRATALDQVRGPATALMVTAAIYVGFCLMGILGNFIGISFAAFRAPADLWRGISSGGVGMAANVLTLAISGLIFYGASKMKQLENHGLAVLASILALLPCTSPCCVLGLPFGIWALVVLYRPEVKSSFH